MWNNELGAVAGVTHELLDSLGVGIVLISPEAGRVVYANREFCRFTGYSMDALTGPDIAFQDLTHPDDRAINLREHERMVRAEVDQYRLDKRYITSTGEVVWAHVTASVVRDVDGRVRWTTRVVEDITTRKLLEQQLAIAEEIGGLATWRLQVKHERTHASPRYKAMFGFAEGAPQPSIDEFLARVHPDDRKSVEANIRRAIAGGGLTHEYRIVQPTGEIRWMRGMATVVTQTDGSVTDLVGATIDITEIKNRSKPDRTPRAIRKVLRHIERNWNKPMSVSEIAVEHDVSTRSIHKHFAAIGTTPMAFIKQIRLERARTSLENATSRTSVTGVAYDCGFTNLGHFARDYRRAFGELPSETLKRIA